MVKVIDLGEITLTVLRNYRLEAAMGSDGHVRLIEVYVVTDDDYTSVPGGQQRREVVLSKVRQTTLDTIYNNAMARAAEREEVEIDSSLLTGPALLRE